VASTSLVPHPGADKKHRIPSHGERECGVLFAEKSVVALSQFFISQGLAADLVQQVPIAVRVLVVAVREPPVAGLVLHWEGRAPKLRASTQCQ